MTFRTSSTVSKTLLTAKQLHAMEAQEMKKTIETIYKIQMAAVKVIEANEDYLAAEKTLNEQPYDWTHKDVEGNNRWCALLGDKIRKEGQLKRAVNAFFKAAGHPEKAQIWDLGFSAVLEYNKFIEDSYHFSNTSNLIPKFSLYNCRARKN